MNIIKTIKLYDEMPYETEFEARVLLCEKSERNENEMPVYQVILDRTLFFPEEGGQSPDKGTIQGMEVVDVQIKDGVISHYVRMDEGFRMVFSEEQNRTVTGKIDWEHRFSNMQQHSGEHIFSGIVFRDYKLNNVGFHLSDHIVTMDFDGVLSLSQIEEVEQKVNRAIAENIEIEVGYPSPEELVHMTYRSKIEIDGPVRIVTIPGYDVCACCAPHVKRTGEIGILKVMTVQNHKGGVRISILCGFRALEKFCEQNRIVQDLMHLLSTGAENLIERVSGLKEQNQEIKMQNAILKQKVMLGKIERMAEEQKDVILIEEKLDTVTARNIVNELVSRHEGVCGIFAGSDEMGYRYILGSRTQDCTEIAERMKQELNAKGGGSRSMIQGSVRTTKEKIQSYWGNKTAREV